MKLAIFGGEPVRRKPLPYASQWIDEEDIESVAEVLRSPFLTTGPKVEEFEAKICDYVKGRYAVAFSSGTAALHGACYAAGIGASDEVIVPGMTFAASSNCVLYRDGTPVFADIDIDTCTISIDEIKKLINKKTKAIIPVDYTGTVCDLGSIMSLARDNNLIVIEDGAHSFGSEYRDKRVGSIADMTMFSFHPVKTITTGEGGVITTNNEFTYKRLKSFRSHSITRDIDELTDKNQGKWYYEQKDLGFNYRLTDVQAALGISQLSKVDKFIGRRKEIKKIYDEFFGGIDGVIVKKEPSYSNTSPHLYIIRLELEKFRVARLEIHEALLAEGIGAHVHYIPVYWHPYYQSLGYKRGLCPKVELLYESMLTVPLFPRMNDEDLENVMDGFAKVLGHFRNRV